MNNNIKITLLAIIIIFMSSISGPGALADKKDDEKKLRDEIKSLREQLNVRNFMVNAYEDFDKDELSEYVTADTKTLVDMEIKFFNSMGMLNGYIVFINSVNEHTVVLNGQLKLTLYSSSFSNGSKVFFISLDKFKFRKMLLNRGDWIIGFPVKSLKYGEKLPQGSPIKIRAEFLHLAAETGIELN